PGDLPGHLVRLRRQARRSSTAAGRPADAPSPTTIMGARASHGALDPRVTSPRPSVKPASSAGTPPSRQCNRMPIRARRKQPAADKTSRAYRRFRLVKRLGDLAPSVDTVAWVWFRV